MRRGQGLGAHLAVVQALKDLLGKSQPPGRHRQSMLEAGVGGVMERWAGGKRGQLQWAAAGFLQEHWRVDKLD